MFTPKEIDLRVSQELKNYQDSIYQINQEIQKINRAIVSLSLVLEENKAKGGREAKNVLIGFDNMSDKVLKHCLEINQRVGDLETKFQKLEKETKERLSTISQELSLKDKFIENKFLDLKKIDIIDVEQRKNKEYFSLAIEQLKSYINQQFYQLRKDLTPDSKKDDAMKKYLEERLNTFKIDFEGLVKEIAILKKAIAYDQKKFENLYTLIERLKEKV